MSNARKPRPVQQRPPKDRVVVAYIHPGQVSSYFCQALTNMLVLDRATKCRIVGCLNEWSSANVSAARNNLVAQFLDERDAEWLFFIDADMAWEHDALDRLLAVADPEKVPIVGGLCFGATFGALFPTIYHLIERDGQFSTIRAMEFPDDELVRCSATGAAFLLIHRSVLTAMREAKFNAAFPWFQETELAGQPAGEDITFCLRAGILGFPVHVHTGVEVGHHKSHVLTNALFQAQKEAARVPADANSG